VVLSNNDGCVIARSNEAKAIGIQMSAPVFKIQAVIKAHGVHVYSSNYALYGDMSQRVMEALSHFTPDLEIYSIDEAFLDLSGFKRCDLTDYGRSIWSTVRTWTGIPVSVGIAETKTLAKIANRIAKKSEKADGVLDLTRSLGPCPCHHGCGRYLGCGKGLRHLSQERRHQQRAGASQCLRQPHKEENGDTWPSTPPGAEGSILLPA